MVPGLTDTCLKNSCADGSTCTLHLGQSREDRQTQVLSHEFSEMISNPDVEATEGWSSGSSSDPHENGDICNGSNGSITVGGNTWNVQQMYSKWDDQQTDGGTTCVLGSSFPLPSLLPACTIILDRSTFGKDEVDAFLNAPVDAGPAVFEAALYVAVDGFTGNQLGITAASFNGTPNVQPSFSFSSGVPGLSIAATALSAPFESSLDILQRFTWVCRVTFTSDGAFPTTVGDSTSITVTAQVSTVSGSADILLVDEPNPYEGTKPDEPMINWGSVLAGSEASIYLPGTTADHILYLANTLYARHRLTIVDNHTIKVPANGVTYLPIPPGVGANYAGLMTIDLPPHRQERPSLQVGGAADHECRRTSPSSAASD